MTELNHITETGPRQRETPRSPGRQLRIRRKPATPRATPRPGTPPSTPCWTASANCRTSRWPATAEVYAGLHDDLLAALNESVRHRRTSTAADARGCHE